MKKTDKQNNFLKAIFVGIAVAAIYAILKHFHTTKKQNLDSTDLLDGREVVNKSEDEENEFNYDYPQNEGMFTPINDSDNSGGGGGGGGGSSDSDNVPSNYPKPYADAIAANQTPLIVPRTGSTSAFGAIVKDTLGVKPNYAGSFVLNTKPNTLGSNTTSLFNPVKPKFGGFQIIKGGSLSKGARKRR